VFKPEFLNRLDDIIVFHQLERNDLIKIVDLEMAKVIERVRAKENAVALPDRRRYLGPPTLVPSGQPAECLN
jgi:ATP-dependent Clp protease ATP-binding subunit ClpC